MNTQIQDNHYFAKCFLECTFGQRSESMVATISENGAQGVQFHSMPYTNIASLAGKIIQVKIAGQVEVQGKVYKETNLGGTSFSIEFWDLDKNKRKSIQGLIAKHQYPAPWARGTERLLFRPRLKSVEIPKMAHVHEPLREIEMKVLNFSRDGIQLEVTGAHKAAWKLGDDVTVDICTNQKEEIKQLQGRVVRITEDLNLETSETIYRYGIQFTDDNAIALRRYTDMIENAEEAYDLNRVAAAA